MCVFLFVCGGVDFILKICLKCVLMAVSGSGSWSFNFQCNFQLHFRFSYFLLVSKVFFSCELCSGKPEFLYSPDHLSNFDKAVSPVPGQLFYKEKSVSNFPYFQLFVEKNKKANK